MTTSVEPQPDFHRPTGTRKFVDPVCGMAVDTVAPKHVEEYDGVAYYFCCGGCRTTFLQEPAKYAAIHRSSLAGVPP